ncbi:MAG: hypothetical protein AB8G15_22515 [Saprospiraceae bacterium]
MKVYCARAQCTFNQIIKSITDAPTDNHGKRGSFFANGLSRYHIRKLYPKPHRVAKIKFVITMPPKAYTNQKKVCLKNQHIIAS